MGHLEDSLPTKRFWFLIYTEYQFASLPLPDEERMEYSEQYVVHPLIPSIHKWNSEYDQEIPLSQTADNPLAPWGRAAQPPRDTRKTN